jgi:hypothetical protein
MLIEGKKNLELLRDALSSHLLYCSDKTCKAFINSNIKAFKAGEAEIQEIKSMLAAVEINLKQIEDSELPSYANTTEGGGV